MAGGWRAARPFFFACLATSSSFIRAQGRAENEASYCKSIRPPAHAITRTRWKRGQVATKMTRSSAVLTSCRNNSNNSNNMLVPMGEERQEEMAAIYNSKKQNASIIMNANTIVRHKNMS